MGEGREDRFSSLQHYPDPEYYSQHPVIYFYTPHETMRYKVTAVLGLTARTEDADYFAFNELIDFPDRMPGSATWNKSRSGLYIWPAISPMRRKRC